MRDGIFPVIMALLLLGIVAIAVTHHVVHPSPPLRGKNTNTRTGDVVWVFNASTEWIIGHHDYGNTCFYHMSTHNGLVYISTYDSKFFDTVYSGNPVFIASTSLPQRPSHWTNEKITILLNVTNAEHAYVKFRVGVVEIEIWTYPSSHGMQVYAFPRFYGAFCYGYVASLDGAKGWVNVTVVRAPGEHDMSVIVSDEAGHRARGWSGCSGPIFPNNNVEIWGKIPGTIILHSITVVWHIQSMTEITP